MNTKNSMLGEFEADPHKIEQTEKNVKSIAHLETKIAQQKEDIKRLKEERYCLLILVIILFDSVIFSNFNNWGDSIAITILELAVLIIMARRCEVDDVTTWLDKILLSLTKRNAKKDD